MTSATDPMNWKLINDPIHKSISLHPLLIKIIDTPEFQRLRDIKQLGFCYKVFPSATCTRFEHSIGVCHLAWRMMEQLKNHLEAGGDNRIVVTDKDKLCVAIAGLCHDLGHGPFSHTWETFMERVAPESEWRHETLSVAIFNRVWDKLDPELKENYSMGEEQRNIICDIIIGEPNPNGEYAEHKDKQFLFEIVANKKSGVDVDKWDYFARDNYYLAMGTRISFEYERLMQCARILWKENEKCSSIHYRDSEKLNFYHMFYIRWMLYHRAYKHRVVKIIEGMFLDALELANKDILIRGKTLSDCATDIDNFLNLNDDVYFKLMNLHENHPAKLLIDRIQRRDLYKCVGQLVTKTVNISAEEIEHEIKRESGLTSEQFYISVEKFDYGKGAEDPVKSIPFYGKDDYEDNLVNCNLPSTMIPDHFEESKVCIICRETTSSTINKATTAFKNWHDRSKKMLGCGCIVLHDKTKNK